MVRADHKPATYADLEAVPSHLVAELLFGALVTHPRPSPRHGAAAISLGDELVGPFQKGRGGPGGWVFLAEPELRLGPHATVPDLAGWRSGRLQSALVEKSYIETPPDWIGEILSPATEKCDRGDKRRIHALYGVPHLWHVDPRAKLLEVFARHDESWLLTHTFADAEAVRAPPFEALSFSLGLLWPFDTPDPATPTET